MSGRSRGTSKGRRHEELANPYLPGKRC